MVYSTSTRYDVEDFLEGCEPTRDIPNGTPLDEMVFYALEAVEIDFNEMMMNVGLGELSCLESTHEEIVYEGSTLENVKENAVKFFQGMWKRVQEMIQKAMKWFQDQSDKIRNNLIKKLDNKNIKAKVDNLKADRSFGSTYEYTDIDKFMNKTIQKINNGDKAVQKHYAKVLNAMKNAKSGNIEDIGDDIKNVTDSVAHNVAGDFESMSKFKEAVKKSIRGRKVERSGAWVKQNWSNIIKEVQDYPESKRTIKNSYEQLRKHFNEAIKNVRQDNNVGFEASAYTKVIKGYKDLRQISVLTEQAVLSCLSEKYSFTRSIVLKVCGSAKPKNESAVVESTTSDRIASLFEW